MKKLFLALAAFALLSCSTEKEATQEEKDFIDNFGDIAVQEVGSSECNTVASESNYLKNISSMYDFTQEQTNYINSKMEEISTLSIGLYKKIVVTYPSVDAQGNEVQLTGAIFMNEEPEDFDEIVLYCHQTSTGNNDVPGGLGWMCLEPNAVVSTPSTVWFASDYVGFNASEQYFHPYMNNSLAARNEIDMMKAGLVYLKNKGYEIKSAEEGLKTYIVGYSQGGAVALATQKALEADKELSQAVNFSGSYCGAGPYNLRTTFQKFLDDQWMSLPLVLPYVLKGMFESYPDIFAGVDIYDYLTDNCKEVKLIEFLESKPNLISASLWTKLNVGSYITDIMSEEAQDLNSDIMKKLFTALDKQNLLDGSWTPTRPIIFYHSDNDDIVSVTNTEEALEKFPSSLCSRSEYEIGLSHVLEFVNYAISCWDLDYRVDEEN